MAVLELLTKEQEELLPVVRKEWLDRFFSSERINRPQAIKSIEWLYKLCNLKEPVILFTESPMACQYAYRFLYLLKLSKELQSLIAAMPVTENYISAIRSYISSDSAPQQMKEIAEIAIVQIIAQLRENYPADFRADENWGQTSMTVDPKLILMNLESMLEKETKDKGIMKLYTPFSTYGNVSDYGWVAFYDFFSQIGVLQNDNLESYKVLMMTGIYDMVQLEGVCIVSEKPVTLTVDERTNLHSATGPAIKFSDGYQLYFWHGINIPDKWMENPDGVTRTEVYEEKNIERRRCLKEILGTARFVKLLDLEIIDEDKDQYGYPVRLYKSLQKDELAEKYWYFYFGVCPSTKREYFISVNECKNVWQAKKLTFDNKSIKYRHGDVGIVEVGKEFDQPMQET